MGIVLPKEIEEMAARRASETGFASVADYIARLVVFDAGEAADAELEVQLLEGLEGPDEEIDIEAMREEGRALIGAQRDGA
ncbi:MAG TPA: hypothetical protein VD978_14930 [Azospirillum sp.]|nr:hypothetical protein [Azospirillum sp.]